MNPLGHNYPAGAEHDPSAPWNQPDDCELCGGEGVLPVLELESDEPKTAGEVTCPECNGTGRQKTRAELRAEYEEDKADMEREER
jgi:DnaJ-class molecular chaperone